MHPGTEAFKVVNCSLARSCLKAKCMLYSWRTEYQKAARNFHCRETEAFSLHRLLPQAKMAKLANQSISIEATGLCFKNRQLTEKMLFSCMHDTIPFPSPL